MNESGRLRPYAGVVLGLTRDWSVYGSHTDIFQAQSATDVNGRKLDPVLGRSCELGIKGELLERRLQLSAAAYRLLQDNVAVAVPGSHAPDGNQAYRAAKGAETRGFELEANGALTPRWNLSAGFARNLAHDAQQQRLNPEIPRNTFKLFSTSAYYGEARNLRVSLAMKF